MLITGRREFSRTCKSNMNILFCIISALNHFISFLNLVRPLQIKRRCINSVSEGGEKNRQRKTAALNWHRSLILASRHQRHPVRVVQPVVFGLPYIQIHVS